MSDHDMVSVLVLIPVMFPVPISVMRVATLPWIAVTFVQSMVSVLALTARVTAPREVDATSVLLLMAVMAAATCAFVLVLTPPMREPMEVDAVRMDAAVDAVPAEIAEAILVDAVVTLAAVAREPAESVASVRFLVPYDQMDASVRELPPRVETATSRLSTICLPTVPTPFRVEVATFQTSAASVPKDVSVRVPVDQTLVGMVARSEVDAVRTVALVLALMVEMAAAS
jgi:hypothetical protein